MTLIPNDHPHPLHQRVEALRRGQPVQTSDLSDGEVQFLLREIQLQQKELQHQNKELDRANRELEALQERYSDLYDFTPVGSLVVDEGGIILEANATAGQMLHAEKDRLVGQLLTAFIYPADHAIYETRQAALRPSGGIQRYIVRLKRANGSLFRGRLHIALIEPGHAVTGGYARIAISDVTELFEAQEALRIAEEQIRTALSVAPIRFFSQDMALRFTWTYSGSSSSAETTGIIGKTDFDIVDNAEQARQLYEFKRRILESEQGDRQTFTLLIQGQLQHWDVMVEPLYNHEGQLMGITGAAVNVTAQAEAEERQQELLEERRKLRLMEGVLSETTHDLKVPLTAMITSAYLLQRAKTEEDHQQHFERIETLGLRLSKMINDLSSIIRLEELHRITLRVLDLGLLLSELVDEYRVILQERHQLLKVSYPTTPCYILGNETYLHRALENILSNASYYTAQGGQIHLRLAIQGQDAVMEIQDTGIGISPDELPFIFDRFFRSARAREMVKTGSGLGLAIAKRIIEVHSGTIAVQSEIGTGTTFIIRIPLKE